MALSHASDLYVVKYIYPKEGTGPAWGYDIGSDPMQRAAIELAVQTGEPIITGRTRLHLDDQKHAGFRYFLPLYKKGPAPKTAEEREAALEGLIYAPIILDLALSDTVVAVEGYLDFEVFDGAETTKDNLLFDYDGHLATATKGIGHAAYEQRMFDSWSQIKVGGRTWTMVTSTTPKFEAANGSSVPGLISVGGILFSVLLAIIVWSLGLSRRQAVALAMNMTAEIRASQEVIRQAKEGAELANRAKSDFLANMSHEIRTPLTAILGFSDILRDDGIIERAPPRRIQAIDTIRSASRHLLSIINDILDLSKIEANKMTVERVSTSLVGVLHEVESLLQPQAIGKGLAFNTALASPVPDQIMSDPTRLRQILMNMAGNAVKFTEVGSVTITMSSVIRNGQSRLVIDVEDTGAGMTPEQSEQLFKAFGQADGTVTRKYGGTGLGLTICRRLAELMGGTVVLARTEPNVGSCFRMDLPLEPAPGAAMVARLERVQETYTSKRSASSSTLTGRLLLAEDGPDNQRLISFYLRNAGAEVEIAENGRIALEMLEVAVAKGCPFDLLLTDMQMPEMDGYTLAKTLRARGNYMPIVALTAHAMAEDRKKCMDAGCNDYASKPIDKAALIATCRQWIESGSAAATPRDYSLSLS